MTSKPALAVSVDEDMASTRDRILASAAGLFLTQGFHATGVNEIGAGAGLSGPALYRHFSSKQEILDTLLFDEFDRMLREVRAISAEHSDPDELLSALIDHRVGIAMTSRQDLVTIFHNDGHHVSAAVAQRILQARESFEQEWLRVLVLLQPKAPVAELRTTVVVTLTMIGHGAPQVRRNQPGVVQEVGEEGLRAHIVRMARAALLTRGSWGSQSQSASRD